MKVLCLWYATKGEIDQIKNALPAGTQVVAPDGEYFSRFESTHQELKAHAIDADVFIGWSLPYGLLEIADNLKLLCWLHSGVNDLDLRLLKERHVKVANVAGANGIAVAEHAMMFILALAKKTLAKHQVAQAGMRTFPVYGDEWRASMLSGRSIAIIGVGGIGSAIAKFAKGFDMHVLGVRRKKDQPVPNFDSMHGMDELHDVLAKADYVVLATPLTPATHQFFGKAEFAAMKQTAYLVNVARGNLIQEKPLYDALTSGRLRGFAADAWHRYEFGKAFPIGYMPRLGVHTLPNVVATIDQGANADDVMMRNIEWGLQSIVEHAADKPITREVDLDAGY